MLCLTLFATIPKIILSVGISKREESGKKPSHDSVSFEDMRNPQQTGPVLRARLVPAGTLGVIGGAAVTALLLFLAYLAIGGGGGEKEAPKIRRTPQRVETRARPTAKPGEAEKSEAPTSTRSKSIPSKEPKAELPQEALPEQGVSSSAIKPDPRGPWVVNAVSVLSESGAQQLQARLEKGGWNAYVSEVPQGGRLWYGVRVGFFQSKDEARQAAQQISERYDLPDYILLHRPPE